MSLLYGLMDCFPAIRVLDMQFPYAPEPLVNVGSGRGGHVPSSIRVRSQAFCGILRTCGHPACGAQGVPLRATALNWSRILRITATTATFPGFPR